MKVAIIGDRGIPARYSGFSTLVEEISVRLANDHGMEITVYGRKQYFDEHPSSYKGVNIVWLPAPGGKSYESITHSNLSILHASLQNYDLVFVVDPGNGPFCLPLKLRGIPVIYHTDGLGWKRTKWSKLQQRYYKWSEWVTTKLATWLVTDSHAMVRYYQHTYSTECTFIPYGSVVGDAPNDTILNELYLAKNQYYLLVARQEPENNTLDLILEYKKSNATRPLIVVGSVPYASDYSRRIQAEADARVKIVGSVFDSGKLNGLYKHCYVYLHGHEVGGTNPSLLRAMGSGAPCLVLGVDFNTEVVGPEQLFFNKEPGNLAALINALDNNPEQVQALSELTLERSRQHYRWDAVASGYGEMFRRVYDNRRQGKKIELLRGMVAYHPEHFSASFEDWPQDDAYLPILQ